MKKVILSFECVGGCVFMKCCNWTRDYYYLTVVDIAAARVLHAPSLPLLADGVAGLVLKL